jgi:hypothetical protein
LQVILVLEGKLAEALKSKLQLMEENLSILQQNRETEERLIHILASMRNVEVHIM